MKLQNRYFLLPLVGLLLAACSQTTTSPESNYQVKSVSGKLIALDSSLDKSADAELAATIADYQAQMDAIMNRVVCEATEDLDRDYPNYPLVAIGADILFETASAMEEVSVDFGVLNVGGVRTSFREGDITVGDVISAFPFENRLCLLTLTGRDTEKLFAQIVSNSMAVNRGVKVVMDGKSIKSITINGKPLSPDKEYTLATIDYLAEGNNGLTQLTQAVKRTNYDLLMRDLMMNYLEKMHQAGRKLSAPTDVRIVR